MVFRHRLLRISQQRIVRSSLADIMNLPPGWKTIPRTQLSWPFSTNKHTPMLMSQIYRQVTYLAIECLEKLCVFKVKCCSIITRMLLSRDPDAKNGPWCDPVLLSVPAASLTACDAFSPAHAIHSTVWSWSRNSTFIEQQQQHWRKKHDECISWNSNNDYLESMECQLHTLHSFVLIFHTRIEWSLEQDANIEPSGWTRTIRTHSRCPI